MSDQIEIVRCQVVKETEKGFLLTDGDNPDRQDWFPKSQVSFRKRNMNTGMAEAEIPLWLPESKGWNQ